MSEADGNQPTPSSETTTTETPPETPPETETPPAEPAEPTKTALGEEPPAPNELIGAPEGDYEAFTMPDGFEPNADLVGKFSPLAKEIGLSQAGAQKVVDLFNEHQQAAYQQFSEQVENWGKETQADKEYGGAAYAENIAVAKEAIKEFGSPELINLLNTSGYGNHPELVRFAYRVGKAFGEAKTRGATSPGGEKKPAHEVLYGGGNQQ